MVFNPFHLSQASSSVSQCHVPPEAGEREEGGTVGRGIRSETGRKNAQLLGNERWQPAARRLESISSCSDQGSQQAPSFLISSTDCAQQVKGACRCALVIRKGAGNALVGRLVHSNVGVVLSRTSRLEICHGPAGVRATCPALQRWQLSFCHDGWICL